MLAEVAPLAVPQFDALLVSVLVIAGAFVALGLVTIIHSFVRATVGGIAGALGHVPGLGGILSSPVNKVAHWMEHEFAVAEAALDGVLSRWFHQLGQLANWIVQELADQAHMLYVLATSAVTHEALHVIDQALLALHRLSVRLSSSLDTALRQLQTFEQEIAHAIDSRIGAAARTLIKPIESELGDLDRMARSRLGALEHGVNVAIPGTLNGLREWADALTHAYARLFERMKALEHRFATIPMAGAVALALAWLGAEWIRCRNWRRVGRGVCGLPDDLIEGLFGLAIDAFILTDLCDFARLIEAEAVLFEPVLDELVNVQNFLCLHGGASLPSGIVAADRRPVSGYASGIVDADLAA